MSADWPEWNVGELEQKGLLLVQDGNHGEYRPRKDEFTESGVAFIRAADLGVGTVQFDKAEKINPDAFQRIRKGIGKDSDTVLSTKGTVGKLAYVPEGSPDFVCSPQTTFWRSLDHEFIDPVYLYYELQSKHFEHQVSSRKGETDMADYLSLTAQRGLTIRVPDKSLQLEIVKKLSSIDKKIELNRQTNQTLEHIAQAIFKSWFVDFEPTRAKIAAKERWLALHESIETSSPTCYAEQFDGPGQNHISLEEAITQAAMAAISGKTIAELEQLNPEHDAQGSANVAGGRMPGATLEQLKATAALFPDALVESELGEVPEGWEVKPLSSWGEVVCGKTPSKKKEEFYGGGIPFIKIPDMHGNMYVVETIDSLTEDGAGAQKKKRLPKGSVCVSCIATVGQVLITNEDSFTNQQINSVVPAEEYFTPYLYFSMLDLYDHLHDLASGGSATLNLNTGNFSKIEILKPSNEALQRFSLLVKPLMEDILSNYHQQAALFSLRDSLLPKLLSGELAIELTQTTEAVA